MQIYTVKFDICMGFWMLKNPCKMKYIHLCKMVPKSFMLFCNMQNLNKIKYFTPGKMHCKTYSFTSLILHPRKITWPQQWMLFAWQSLNGM
jgi:hypothetical protein